MQKTNLKLPDRIPVPELSLSQEIPPDRSRSVSLDIALTSRCPLSCRYCTVEKIPTRELSSKQWGEVIGSIAGLKTIESISLEGGEPFAREDLSEILASALRYSRRVKIVTSGAFLSRMPVSLVSDPRFSFEVSLDGPTPIHNFLRDRSYDQAFRFLKECLRTGIEFRFRTVISMHNFPFYEPWIEELDRSFEGAKEKIGFFFDTIIPPRVLSGKGGSMRRVPARDFPAHMLVPSPLEIQGLFGRMKNRTFRNLRFLQEEPIRGCRAGESPCISFDPAGIYSGCCESPNGFGSILEESPETCLSLLERLEKDSRCRTCPYFGKQVCLGCWTGQKCGMVGYWGFAQCRDLFSFIAKGTNPHVRERKKSIITGQTAEI